LLDQLPLLEFLGLVSMKRRRTKELVIILDQFEQFLISLPREVHQSFIEVIRDCYEDSLLPVRFIISLKAEDLGELDPFEKYIPGILQNRYRLLRMSEEEMKEAIVGPVRKVNPDISFEPALLDQLIGELGGNNVELTHLQIVCSQLYNSLLEGEKVITTALYDKLGGVEKILATYLDKTLEPLPGNKHKIAWEILRELVSSEGTNRILRLPDFERAVEPDPSVIEEVLQYLVNSRLLRRSPAQEAEEYELAHDYLADEISLKIGKEELENKKAQDLLQRELANNRIFHTRIDPEQLNYLKQHIRFLTLDDPAQRLLFESALQQGHDVNFWLEQMDNKPEAVRQAASVVLVNKAARKRIIDYLKGSLPQELQSEFWKALFSNFTTAKRWKKVDAARILWIFRRWLPQKQRLQVVGVLAPIWASVVLFSLIPLGIVILAVRQAASDITAEQPVAIKWIDIPEGSFLMGMDEEEAEKAYQGCLEVLPKDLGTCDLDFKENSPLVLSGRQEGAWLPSYSILENEVTTAQYKLCIEEDSCKEPPDWDRQQQAINFPVQGVTWSEASTYCAWLGGRLPTEAEWEKAARGPENNLYPYGPTWDPDKANIEHNQTGSLQSVLNFAETDLSGYNVLNLTGNVREWTASQYLAKLIGQPFSDKVLTQDFIDSNADNIDILAVVKGGSWATMRTEGMSSRRGAQNTERGRDTLGFRCVCPDPQTCSIPGGTLWSLLTRT
jgi:formylglycine-generating enzyme required for sulfatase activity